MSQEESNTIFGRGTWQEASRLAGVLRSETVGGALLLVATVLALTWANSPLGDSYEALREFTVGPKALHLDLTLGEWAADGLLAIFFFVVGLELKREFVAGDLNDPKRAALPIIAAVGGMVFPALIFVGFNLQTGDGALTGWAIPTATDIAFAVAVLAVISSHLPTALRIFLLTLAVVDDLLAVTIIAIFYTSELHVWTLLATFVPIVVFAVLVQKRITHGYLLIPLALIAWTLMHSSGVHATVAGVLLGFTVPVNRSKRAGGPGAGPGLAEHLEHLVRPVSSGFAVPVFAFFAAGVAVGGLSGLRDSLGDTVALGIIVGLVAGKTIGVFGTTWVVSKVTKADLDPSLQWVDVFGLALLAGIGFTVSLLIGDLAYGLGSDRDEHVKVGVLMGSLISSLLATIVLRARNAKYKTIEENENVDADGDGIPDVYQKQNREEQEQS